MSTGPRTGDDSPNAAVFRLAIVVGHNRRQPGASAVFPISKVEFDFNNAVADAMVGEGAHYNMQAKRFNRIHTGSYRSEIANVYASVDAWRPDCILELHFNSASPQASGSEMLYATGKASARTLALELAQEVAATLKLSLRHGDGTRALGAGDRGHASVVASSTTTVLVEPFFGSNKGDCLVVASVGEATLGRAYLRAVRDWAAVVA